LNFAHVRRVIAHVIVWCLLCFLWCVELPCHCACNWTLVYRVTKIGSLNAAGTSFQVSIHLLFTCAVDLARTRERDIEKHFDRWVLSDLLFSSISKGLGS
jgi:hypothetical protein